MDFQIAKEASEKISKIVDLEKLIEFLSKSYEDEYHIVYAEGEPKDYSPSMKIGSDVVKHIKTMYENELKTLNDELKKL